MNNLKMHSIVALKVLLVFCVLCKTCQCIDLCGDTDLNLTSYTDTEIQNCGCQHGNSCIRKCCKSGFYLGKKRTCRKVNTSEVFEIATFKKRTTFSKVISNKDNFRIGILKCRYYRLNNLDANDTYFLQENGLLWMPYHKSGIFYENTEYCVDELDGLAVFTCFPQESAAEIVTRNVNAMGMIISMPFLLATFLVYAILPDRNIHQRALMFYVLTLLISYMLLVSINLSENIISPWCEIFGYSTLYFFMVSFFWMNVICFDIWYTFSGGRGFVGSKRTSERKRLLLYSLYAFGVPLLVALLVLLLQNKVLPENSEHSPGIGIKKCFLGDGWPNLWYFYLEAGLLVIINIIFFTLTALKIRQVKKETSMLKHNDSQRHSYEKDKQKFNLYVKLLFAMGVNWSMEVISWLVNWRTSNNIQYIWWATDFFNAVYGVFIFFMFVFKKKIWKLLQRRYYTLAGKPHLAHTMTTTNATRTSHYSSTNYSTADTSLTDRTNVSNGNGRGRPEEMALRTVT